MSTVSKTVSRILAATFLGSLASAALAADEAPSADSGELTEVTVTANKLNATKVLDRKSVV